MKQAKERHRGNQGSRAFVSCVWPVRGKCKKLTQQYVGASFRHHNPYFPGMAEALRAAMQENAAQFPQKAIEIKRVLAEGDLVAINAHVRLNPGDSGVATIHIFRFEGDLASSSCGMSGRLCLKIP